MPSANPSNPPFTERDLPGGIYQRLSLNSPPLIKGGWGGICVCQVPGPPPNEPQFAKPPGFHLIFTNFYALKAKICKNIDTCPGKGEGKRPARWQGKGAGHGRAGQAAAELMAGIQRFEGQDARLGGNLVLLLLSPGPGLFQH